MNILESLIRNIMQLPGIGKKSATRIAYYLLQGDGDFNTILGDQIASLKRKIKKCSICGNYTENDPCSICTDPKRDGLFLCVVEQSQDIITLEQTHEYHGYYHVLGGVLSPLDGQGPEEIGISSLLARIRKENYQEIILATNPTIEGDSTALYIVNLLKDHPVKVTRLASGMPVGGDLEYTDRLTLARSLKGRMPI